MGISLCKLSKSSLFLKLGLHQFLPHEVVVRDNPGVSNGLHLSSAECPGLRNRFVILITLANPILGPSECGFINFIAIFHR